MIRLADETVAPPQSPAQITGMKRQHILTLTASMAASMGVALSAHASSSDWHEGEGGRIRLVTSGKPDAQGNLQGVLDIMLKPGWKTYWRDPGSSGVPPHLDISASTNISKASLSFPAPQRHDDGYGAWAGYAQSVAFPIVFTLASPGTAATIDANVFLGMCDTICIPVQANLTLDPASDPDNADDAALVKAGLAALPGAPRPDFGAKLLPGDHETLAVETTAPGDPAAVDFFVAGESDFMFGTPTHSESDGKVIFKVPILDRPTTAHGAGLPYTLTSAEGSVQGFLPYP
jgi:DsbC/DsbD-like thiol-disulfide interchange protein